MITLQDCIDLCGLDAATALASYLLKQPHGGDIHKVFGEGRVRHAAELFMALQHFLEHHPEGRAG
jgi:hypothetical protein